MSQEPRHILLLSGGKDSTALALYMRDHYPEIGLEYVFCDTQKRASRDVLVSRQD
jgi:tRNA(Ile)-lysidine synthase TilS/MesJ